MGHVPTEPPRAAFGIERRGFIRRGGAAFALGVAVGRPYPVLAGPSRSGLGKRSRPRCRTPSALGRVRAVRPRLGGATPVRGLPDAPDPRRPPVVPRRPAP